MRASLVGQRLKCLPAMWEIRVRSLGREDPLEKEMATHSSTLAWRIPWREEPGRLQSMGLQRVEHDWATSLSLSFYSTISQIFLFSLRSILYLLSLLCMDIHFLDFLTSWLPQNIDKKLERRNRPNPPNFYISSVTGVSSNSYISPVDHPSWNHCCLHGPTSC